MMDDLRDQVNRNKEIRQFIRRKIGEELKRILLNELKARITQLHKVPGGTASRLVREDRDRHA